MDKLFLFLSLAVLAAIAVGVVVLANNSTKSVEVEVQNYYSAHLDVLSDKARVLINSADTPSLKRLLTNYVVSGETIKYIFVKSGGRAYVHTFSQTFPQGLLNTHSDITNEMQTIEVTLPDGSRCYDYAVLIGLGNATIHMGIPVEIVNNIAFQSASLPFLLIGFGLLLFACLAGFSGFRYFLRKARSIPKSAPAIVNEPDPSQEHWKKIVESIPAGVFVVDPEIRQILFVNRFASGLIGKPGYQIQGMYLDDFLDQTTSGDLPLSDIEDSPDSTRGYLKTVRDPKLPIAKYSAMVSFEGSNNRLFTFFDISHQKDLEFRLKQAYAQQENLANYDKLTRLFNRRAIQKHAEAELNRAERGGILSLLMMDIDEFKAVNDKYGHNAGDLVLKTVADVLRQVLRPYDWLGRWGGEEFLVVLPDTPMTEAVKIAERIRTSVAGKTIQMKAYREIQVTISIGITATDEESGHSFILDRLVSQADEALYNSKESGRNKISLYRAGELVLVSSKR